MKSVGIQASESHTGLKSISGSSISMSSLGLPVYVSHESCPEKEILIYALLDTQSDTTFVTDRTCELLGVEGVRTSLRLSTLSAKNQVKDSSKVDGLSVRGYNSALRIPLPVTFTRCDIPANRSHITTQNTAKQWPHLQDIADELAPDLKCDIGLLIGYNCPKALAPKQVIPPVDDGPYAQKTDLGWGIVGVVDPDKVKVSENDVIGFSHFIVTSEVPAVCKIGTGNFSNRVQVCFKSKVKEIVSPSEITRLFELEFNERNLGTSYSQDDRKFLSILKSGVRQLDDGHYQLPLPLKTSEILPNNKSLALYRLNHLKRKLTNDIVYANDYCAFMEGVIDKGYAEKIPVSEWGKSSGVNYIPHHGVYCTIPQNLGKLELCSTVVLSLREPL